MSPILICTNHEAINSGKVKSYGPYPRNTLYALILSLLVLFPTFVQAERPDKRALNFWYVAIYGGAQSEFEEGLRAGFGVNTIFDDGMTPLLLCADEQHDQMLIRLISLKARINFQEKKNGNTALMLAAIKGHVSIVSKLLQAKADTSLQDHFGNTALHKAAYYGHLGIVRLLSGAGVPLDKPESDGLTALHLAASQGKAPIVAELLRFGATPDLTDKSGRTPADWAKLNGHTEVESLILKSREKASESPEPQAVLRRFVGRYRHIDRGTSYVGDTYLHILPYQACLMYNEQNSRMEDTKSKLLVTVTMCDWSQGKGNSIQINFQGELPSGNRVFYFVPSVSIADHTTAHKDCLIEAHGEEILPRLAFGKHLNLTRAEFFNSELFCKK